MALEFIGATIAAEAFAGTAAATIAAESFALPLIADYSFGALLGEAAISGLGGLFGEAAVAGAAEAGLGSLTLDSAAAAAGSEAGIGAALTETAGASGLPLAPGTTADANLANQIQQGLKAPAEQGFRSALNQGQGLRFDASSLGNGLNTTTSTIDYGLNAGNQTQNLGRSLNAARTLATQQAAPKAGFFENPWEWAKQNPLPAAGGAYTGLKLMGALDPKTGINTPTRTVRDSKYTYKPGVQNPNWGKPGEPYFIDQGYGPMTSSTRTVAAGGGIKALSSGGYLPLETRRGERPRKLYSPEDSEAFENYEKTDINAKEEKDQAKIDKVIDDWWARHTKAGIEGVTKNLAEGGLTTPQPAPMLNMYSQPSVYGTPPQSFNPMQGSGFNSNAPSYNPAQVSPLFQQTGGYDAGQTSPLFQQTGGSAQSGIQDYINSMASYAPPQAAAAAPVYNATDATVYDPATQSFISNPNYVAPVAAATSGASGDDGGDTPAYRVNDNYSDKAGGPIKAKKFAMGGLAALPEYAAGGQLLSGAGDGMSDSIPAVIKGERPQRAALADGEFVIPADVVSHLGNGSTKAGGKRLYEMMARVRKVRTGNPKQGKQINPMKFLPT